MEYLVNMLHRHPSAQANFPSARHTHIHTHTLISSLSNVLDNKLYHCSIRNTDGSCRLLSSVKKKRQLRGSNTENIQEEEEEEEQFLSLFFRDCFIHTEGGGGR